MIHKIADSQVHEYFNQIMEYLLDEKNRIKIELTRTWSKTFTKEAGVYCIFIDNQLGYVGETGKLRGRMSDLLNTKNHTLRRSLGGKYFSTEKGYVKASSHKSYSQDIEERLNNLITERLTVSHLAITIGRKEFEEWLQTQHSQIIFLNKRKKRK